MSRRWSWARAAGGRGGAPSWERCGRSWRSGGDGFEGDVVAELFELSDDPVGFALGVLAAVVVVGAEVVVLEFGIGHEMPEHDGDAVGNGDGCSVLAAAAGDAPVSGGKVGVFGLRRPIWPIQSARV